MRAGDVYGPGMVMPPQVRHTPPAHEHRWGGSQGAGGVQGADLEGAQSDLSLAI